MELKERILESTNELFFQYGVKSITMDDIANHLGISKKTIYEVFKNKNELVKQIVELNLNFTKSEIELKLNNSLDAIDAVVQITVAISGMMERMNPKLIYDLQKYHANAWKVFVEFKNKFLVDTVIKYLRRGKREGVFRPDMKLKVLAKIRIEQIESLLDPRAFPADQYSIKELMNESAKHFIIGVTTLKGHKLFNSYNKTYEIS